MSDFVVGGSRPVTVSVPASYDASRPAPLLLVLHGYGSSGASYDGYFNLGAAAAKLGFLYAHPDGTRDAAGQRFWNATDACCDFFGSHVDDSTYLEGVIDAIRAHVSVDPKRIYLVGHSNGAFMDYRMACDHAADIAAIVSLAGATYRNASKCRPSSPVSILEVHATGDRSVRYAGGVLPPSGAGRVLAAYPGAETTAATWAAYDGCAATPVRSSDRMDVDADLDGPSGPAEAVDDAWTGCKPGGAVELWTIPGGRHGPKLAASFPGELLDFLLAHPKP